VSSGALDDNAGGVFGVNNDVTKKKDDGIIPEHLRRMAFDEVTDALRSFGIPIRLFGETASSRLHRLFIAEQGREAAALGESEMDEFANRERTRNVFLPGQDDDDDVDVGENEGRKIKSHGGRGSATVVALTEEERNDKPKRIYRYFKSILKQWEDDLTHRPDTIKRSAAGKNETKTVKQCKDYIRPLFQMCKRRQLEEEMQTKLFDIVVNCEAGEFVRAHDSYMDVAIGRAAWPIGVTMVGIHARSGREKIGTSNVAHMMNSEANRKYLTSVKRLMSYAQKKRPDVHPSKKVTNV
jgi:pre-mRNA-splicing factor 18